MHLLGYRNRLFLEHAPSLRSCVAPRESCRLIADRRRWAGPFLAVLVAGCVHQVSGENLTEFSKASSAVAQQADLAFSQSNKLARDVEIDAFIRSGKPGLSEEAFQGAIPRDSMIAWQESLTALADYSALLASLVDTNRGVETSNAVMGLAQKLNTGTVGAGIGPRVSTAFAALGGALVDAAGQREALKILQRTDPRVQELLSAMAEAIGASDGEGLRGTVFSLATASLNPSRRAYAEAAGRNDEDLKREIIGQYLEGLDAREVRIRSLANLRASLVSLAAAHAAAARGGDATAGTMIAEIDRRLDETRRLYKAATDEGDANGSK